MKKIILLIIVLAAGIALGIYFQRQPKTQKIEDQLQSDAAQAGADVKAGEQKVDAAAADVKAGVQKASEVATNVVGDVKAAAQKVDQAATNAVGEVKQKMN
jgi:outer membrane murein-binding lipoprotein Lpp